MIKKLFIYLFLLILSLGCSSYNDESHEPSIAGDIVDSTSWYSDMNDNVVEMIVKVPVPNDYQCKPYNDLNAPSRPCTLDDVNNDNDANDDYSPILHVQMKADSFVPSNETANASFKQKGKTTRGADQKSYRVKLDSKTDLYASERTFQLGKHFYDDSRIRNKLAFELFIDIPNITSLKTKFVELNVTDGLNPSEEYGLFTHVEKVGDEFIKNRGWDEDDNIYKAQNFDFTYTSDLALDSKGKPLDPDAFDAIIEIENGKEHTKLIDMINAIGAAESDAQFEALFSKYFNRNNYITWMASNIVLGNKDTTSQNFFLYNPKYSDTFYFMPWDYDGTSRDKALYAKWELGIATWWQVPLHRKFLNIQKNRDDLDTMVINLRANYISDVIIQTKLDRFEPIVRAYVSQNPDANHLTVLNWENEFNKTKGRISDNVLWYNEEKGAPMPFWQTPVYDNANDVLTLWWDISVDLEGDAIAYDLVVADNPDFNAPLIVDETALVPGDGKLKVPQADQEFFGDLYFEHNVSLANGTYYMKVTARETTTPALDYQISLDRAFSGGNVYQGVREFIIE